jgi:hypothetical protein
MNMPKYPRHMYPEADDHTPAERGDQAGSRSRSELIH